MASFFPKLLNCIPVCRLQLCQFLTRSSAVIGRVDRFFLSFVVGDFKLLSKKEGEGRKVSKPMVTRKCIGKESQSIVLRVGGYTSSLAVVYLSFAQFIAHDKNSDDRN